MSRISLVLREETSQLICVVSCVEQVFDSNLCNIIYLNLVNNSSYRWQFVFLSSHLVPLEDILAIFTVKSKANMVRIQINGWCFLSFRCPIQRPLSGVKTFLYSWLILDHRNECLILCVCRRWRRVEIGCWGTGPHSKRDTFPWQTYSEPSWRCPDFRC